MTQYISKSALVVEIEKRIKEREEEEKKGWAYSRVKIVECEHILSFIDTLEVKEVDIEKETKNWIENNQDTAGFFNYVEFAKHFFELALSLKNS